MLLRPTNILPYQEADGQEHLALWNSGRHGLPLRALLDVCQKDLPQIPRKLRWEFQTKLQQGAELVAWAAELVFAAGKRLWIVADGFYAKRPFCDSNSRRLPAVGRCREEFSPSPSNCSLWQPNITISSEGAV
jgi:hypothetical protein